MLPLSNSNIKGRGMCCPLFGKVHINNPVQLKFPRRLDKQIPLCLLSNSQLLLNKCPIVVSDKTKFNALMTALF